MSTQTVTIERSKLEAVFDVLEECRRDPRLKYEHPAYDKAITAIKEALAQPEQERVAWLVYAKGSRRYFTLTFDVEKVPEIYKGGEAVPLYTTPYVATPRPQRTAAEGEDTRRAWVGLTDDEIDQGLLRSDYAFKTAEAWRAGVVFAMTKLKEKNNGSR